MEQLFGVQFLNHFSWTSFYAEDEQFEGDKAQVIREIEALN